MEPSLEPREAFERIARRPEAEIDLGEAALWLAAEACPDLDVRGCLQRIDAIAEASRPHVEGVGSLAGQVAVLNRQLFEVFGFRGNRDDYYDPRNSYLNQVLDRRVGIPISLCVLYVEVARRLGLDAAGVSFPGHFLARVGPEPLIVDAFEGRLTSRRECGLRLRAALGPDAELGDEHLAPASKKRILLRMLGNLKAIHAGRREFESALGCCDRALMLFPDEPGELRDRGLMYHALDCPRPALADLERFLELAPEGDGSQAVRQLVGQLYADLPPIH